MQYLWTLKSLKLIFRPFAAGYHHSGDRICGQRQLFCELRGEVCHSSELHYPIVLLHWNGDSKV